MIPTYDDLILNWYARSDAEEEIFTKFIFLYIAFIAFLTINKPFLSDRGKINELKNSIEAKKFYLELKDRNQMLQETLIDLTKELKKEPIKNVTRYDDPHWRGPDGKLIDENDWENLVEYWYRVRNNLFHGHKTPIYERDKRLVTFAYITLHPLMKNFVDHSLSWEFY